MIKPRISAVAAIGKDTRVIGKNNSLIWHIKEDLQRFKSITLNHPIIMGRKNYESIGRPLPLRTNIIITRNPEYKAEGCVVTHSLQEAIDMASKIDQQEIFIIGGGEIYTQALPITDRLYLTVIDDTQDGDTFFPDYSQFKKIIIQEDHPESTPPYTYIELEK